MKRYIHASSDLETIHVTMYLHPIIYAGSQVITSAVKVGPKKGEYHTDVAPDRVINGPLSEYGEELQSPLKEEYESFIEDCLWLVKEMGFIIINTHQSVDSKKSEYVIVYGLKNKPCGSIVYDLRLSDHPFDATFPEECKEEALEYLKINKILDGSATEAGIDFSVEKVTVGSVKFDTWDRAFQRLYAKLKIMAKRIQVRLTSRR